MRVIVLERAAPGGGASWVAAGMIAPISEARPKEESLLALSLASARAYPRFAAELGDVSGCDPGYLGCGTLAAARDRDEAEALERELAMRVGLGLPVRRLRPSEARRLEPGLAPAVRLALDVPDDHVIEPHALTGALAEAFRRAGGELCAGCDVAEVCVSDGRVGGVRLASGDRVCAEQVVIAAGLRTHECRCVPSRARRCACTTPAGPGC
jgi:glycine oxidase